MNPHLHYAGTSDKASECNTWNRPIKLSFLTEPSSQRHATITKRMQTTRARMYIRNMTQGYDYTQASAMSSFHTLQSFP